MALASVVRSRNVKRIAVSRLLYKAGRSFVRGEPRTALALLGAAALTTRSMVLGVLAEGALWLYRREGSREPERPFKRRPRLGGLLGR